MSRRTHRWERGDDFPIRDADLLDVMVDAKMPRVLLGEGDRPDAFDAPRVAIVGTRAATPMGIADAREIAAFCAPASPWSAGSRSASTAPPTRARSMRAGSRSASSRPGSTSSTRAGTSAYTRACASRV